MCQEISYNIAVVDDKRRDSEKLQQSIHRWFTENHEAERSISCFNDGLSLLKVFEPEKFNIVFMDIIMNKINGIDTARQLRDSDSRILLVFTSASDEFAFDVFPLHPFDYMMKPYSTERVGHVLSEAVRVLEAVEPSFAARVSRNTYQIPLRKISAVLSRDHFVEVVMSDGNSMICSMKFGEAEELLMKDSRFLLCARGVIINMDCVSSLSRDKSAVIMPDGTHYAFRVRSRNELVQTFTQYQISRIRGGGGIRRYGGIEICSRNCNDNPGCDFRIDARDRLSKS